MDIARVIKFEILEYSDRYIFEEFIRFFFTMEWKICNNYE